MLIGNSSKDYWIVFTRSLQFIVILALITVPIPALNIDLFQALNGIAFYDVMGDNNLWSYFPFLKFNNNDVPYIVQQMQSISFESTNAFLGLGTISVYLLAYFAQVIFAMLVKIFKRITDKKFIKKSLLKKLIAGLFFNSILSMTMEGFLEFIVFGFLSIYARDTTTNGEILGLIFGFICISLVVFLIIALIWSIFFKNEK